MHPSALALFTDTASCNNAISSLKTGVARINFGAPPCGITPQGGAIVPYGANQILDIRLFLLSVPLNVNPYSNTSYNP